MKVILIKDVARVGKRGEVKEVPSGHALNFLIPRKLAEPATPENLKRQKNRASKEAYDAAASDESFDVALKKLSEMTVELSETASEQGHLFKGVKSSDVSARLRELGISVPEEYIVLEHPLKTLGKHEISLKKDTKQGTFTLSITQK